MSKATNPVAIFLADNELDALEWFKLLRQRRNDMKAGAFFPFSALRSDGPGLAVTFSRSFISPTTRTPTVQLHGDGDTQRTVRLNDVIDDVQTLNAMLRLVQEVP